MIDKDFAAERLGRRARRRRARPGHRRRRGRARLRDARRARARGDRRSAEAERYLERRPVPGREHGPEGRAADAASSARRPHGRDHHARAAAGDDLGGAVAPDGPTAGRGSCPPASRPAADDGTTAAASGATPTPTSTPWSCWRRPGRCTTSTASTGRPRRWRRRRTWRRCAERGLSDAATRRRVGQRPRPRGAGRRTTTPSRRRWRPADDALFGERAPPARPGRRHRRRARPRPRPSRAAAGRQRRGRLRARRLRRARGPQGAARPACDVLLFSDNVSVADEVELKEHAARLGRLVMGPGAGTAMLGGAGLGFANVVAPRPGRRRRRGRHRRAGGDEPARPLGRRRHARDRRRRARPVAPRSAAAWPRWPCAPSARPGHRGRSCSSRSRRRRPRPRAVVAGRRRQAARGRARRPGRDADRRRRDRGRADARGRRPRDVLAALGRPAPDVGARPAQRRSTRGLAGARPRAHAGPRPVLRRDALLRGAGRARRHARARCTRTPRSTSASACRRPPGSHICLDLGEEEYTRGRPHPMIDPEARHRDAARAGRAIPTSRSSCSTSCSATAPTRTRPACSRRRAPRSPRPDGPRVVAYVLGTERRPAGLRRASAARSSRPAAIVAPTGARAALAAAAIARRDPRSSTSRCAVTRRRRARHLLHQAARRGRAHARARRGAARSGRAGRGRRPGRPGRRLLPPGRRAHCARPGPAVRRARSRSGCSPPSTRCRRAPGSARRATFVILHAQDCISPGPRPRPRRRGAPVTVVRTVHHVDDFTTPALIECQRRRSSSPTGVLVVSEMWQTSSPTEYGVRGHRRAPTASTPSGSRRRRRRRRAPSSASPGRAPSDRFLFLAVGGIEPRKGSDHLVRALAQLRERMAPPPVLAVIGGHSFQDYGRTARPCSPHCPSWAWSSGATSSCSAPCPTTRCRGWYHAADALAFPSVKEGFGLVVLEAHGGRHADRGRRPPGVPRVPRLRAGRARSSPPGTTRRWPSSSSGSPRSRHCVPPSRRPGGRWPTASRGRPAPTST